MHSTVFSLFDRLCTARRCGGDVLEIGALPTDDTLLCLPALAGARSRIGVNLDGPHRHGDFEILRADANSLASLPGFGDATFDTVLCNSVLEHDPFFWKTLAEMKRVTRPGGVIGIGVPGYAKLPVERRASRLAAALSWIGVPAGILDPLRAATLTLQIHNHPGDYYRFSPQAVAEVFLEGLEAPEVHTLMLPPRVIGFGVIPSR
jgi:SAM-dependent methyltransferase